MCGGAGTRLWPLSRRSRPKQLLPLASERSLLEDTLLRCAPFADPVLIGSDDQRFLLAEAVRRAGRDLRILTEPSGRNTAAAAAVAALEIAGRDSEALVLLLPADHRIDDAEAFLGAVRHGVEAADDGHIVVFGVCPDRPHTGYGWIEPADGDGVRPVVRFVEKPGPEEAVRHLAAGMLWNAGIFLFRPSVLLAELERFAPEVLGAASAALAEAQDGGTFVRLADGPWAACPAIPIDVAVMERTRRAAVVPVAMGWTDLGSYDALHERAEKDPDGNALVGQAVQVGCTRSYLHGEDLLVTAVGLDDVVVVGTPDAVLVAPRSRAGEVRDIVRQLGEAKVVTEHPRAERPWGRYRVIDQGTGYQVKRIVVQPGERLSLQRHRHRLEHWVVVQGEAVVLVGDREATVNVGEHVVVPIGAPHRLANRTEVPVHLVEVQVGGYLGEDDIERLEDAYGRDSHD